MIGGNHRNIIVSKAAPAISIAAVPSSSASLGHITSTDNYNSTYLEPKIREVNMSLERTSTSILDVGMGMGHRIVARKRGRVKENYGLRFEE
ncbi:unnamed protein product [Nezara viridula]|uniref:Uncharacterized protein n=1 Tax=Nezara viridula TaxID=85310 RepID=A0A9P0H5H7_NEZVI|nr:unnamed protein product [Nezara viridula]